MKIILLSFLTLLVLLGIATVVYLYHQGSVSKSGIAPGLVDGQLAKCPNKPNCVNSEFTSDTSHFIQPLTFAEGENTDAQLDLLAEIINEHGGSIEKRSDNYLAAIFVSGFFRFIDDVEIRLDEKAGVVHLRSASRVGHSDFGANKTRAKMLRSALHSALR